MQFPVQDFPRVIIATLLEVVQFKGMAQLGARRLDAIKGGFLASDLRVLSLVASEVEHQSGQVH